MSIRVLNRFPCANVRVLQVRSDGSEAEVRFAADTHGGPESMWFYFKIDDPSPAAEPPANLTLTLHFFNNMLGGWNPETLRPVIREQGKQWFRLRAPVVERQPDGQDTLSWTIPYPANVTEVALCYPYYRDELAQTLTAGRGYWQEDNIGLTQGGRLMPRLRNEIEEGCQACPNPRGLYLLCRQHAGETPGAWVLDGMLTAFARAKPVNWCIWVVPFADLDGVHLGNYGKDAFPYDLNRAWGQPPMRHETLVIQRDLARWSKRCKPELVLDLHAPGLSENSGVYAFPMVGKTPEQEKSATAWSNVFQQAIGPEYADENFARRAAYASRWETPRLTEHVRDVLHCTAVTIETPYAMCRDLVLTTKQYREIGQRLARAVMQRNAALQR